MQKYIPSLFLQYRGQLSIRLKGKLQKMTQQSKDDRASKNDSSVGQHASKSFGTLRAIDICIINQCNVMTLLTLEALHIASTHDSRSFTYSTKKTMA